MFKSFMLLGMIFGQLVLGGQHDHCDAAHKKVTAKDMVRSINKTPKITWKASTYKLKEVDLKLIARTKLGVKMEDMRMMSSAEMRKLEKQSKNPSRPEDKPTLPENFTWAKTNRTKCRIDTIRDQSNCGSCWAVAPASILSDNFCLKSNGSLSTPLSHQKLLTCITKNYGCSGGYMRYLFEFFMENGTITGGEYESDEGCQPYSIRPCGTFSKFPCSFPEAITPKCKGNVCSNEWYKYKIEKNYYKMLEYKWVPAYFSDDQARQYIYDSGPILSLFWVYSDFVFYKKGIYIHKIGWWPLGGHAVRVVGWGVENGIKFWHVANSWGNDWGENGFFRIRRGTNECSFEWNLYALVPNYTNGTNS